MNTSTVELERRLKAARGKLELSKLRDEIRALMESPEFQQLSQADKNRIEDLLVEMLAREEQFGGCDPLRSILGH
jgi:hypothetical protein